MATNTEALLARAARVLSPSVYGTMRGRIGNPLLPPGAPHFYTRARGARLWDADGREYIDYLGGLGPNLLGYGHPEIEAAAERQRALCDTMTGPAPVLVELAEKFVGMIAHADWVLFAKNGVDAINAALLISRATTGKRRVLVAEEAYHGAAPWCTPVTVGVLPEQRAHRATFVYNDIASLEAAVAAAGNDLAAIFATAFKHDGMGGQELPTVEYARRCREICDRTGAMLVIDDVRAGFRLARDCSWSLVGVQPDLSCWSKAIANGYALSAVLGSERARAGAVDALITGTYWHQAVPMAAGLATLEIIAKTPYLEHTIELGKQLRAGLDREARAYDFELNQSGPVQMPHVLFRNDPDLRFAMAFVAGMIGRGIFISALHNIFICAAMTREDIAITLDAARETFAEMAEKRTRIEPHPLLKAAPTPSLPER